MKFNFKNTDTSLSFNFQNKTFESNGYEIQRFENCDISDDEELKEWQLSADNLSLVVRFYSRSYLPISSLSENNFVDVSYSDVLVRLKDSKYVKRLEITDKGISSDLNGFFNVDIENFEIHKIYEDHVAYIIGFYGSTKDGYMFSPLVGYDKNNPSTWLRFSSDYHRIKLYDNIRGDRFT